MASALNGCGRRRSLLRSIASAAFALALPLAASPPASAAPEPVTVFAAASLKNSLDAVDSLYQQKTGGAVRASYAASSTLARQIEQGAPAQVFISADADWMDYAVQHGLMRTETRRDLLANHLALVAPASSSARLKIAPGFPLASALGAGRLALAGLDVPAGRYAKASLTALGVWPQVESKVVYGDSVRAALAFVSHGEAPFGVVYDTDAKVDPGVRIVDLFPDDSHPRIVYPAALTKLARGPAASAYLAFVEGPEAAAVFRRFGFEVAH
jgi:molybdate transport system substrate-binding protein